MKNKILLLIAVATLGLTTATMAQVPSYVPTNGLVGYWPFNGNANDESGNGNNGTVNGATLTTDRFGNVNKAYSFDGFDDFISCLPIPISGSAPRSITFWYKETATVTTGNTAFSWGAPTQGNRFDCGMSPSGAGVGAAFSAKFFSYISLPTNWNMYTIILPSITNPTVNDIKVYQNGVLLTNVITSNSINVSTPINTTANQLLNFGKNNNFTDQAHLLGNLDDIGIWNRALTQQEITDLYNGCQLSVNIQPANQTININNTAYFVVGSSDTNATYQWQTNLGVGFQNLNNAGQYSGTAKDTLMISNVSMSNNNQQFRCIINNGSCADTSNIAVLSVNNNVGINELAQKNLFSVFPNPAKNTMHVKADHKLIGSVFTIYDNIGKAVKSGKLNAANTTIDLSNLSGGIYLFSVGENRKQTFKIIKE